MKEGHLQKSVSGSEQRKVGTRLVVMFGSAMDTESTTESECIEKKNSEGFPMFFTLKFFKTAFMGDLKQWSSRH
jgi:hypothetical protein